MKRLLSVLLCMALSTTLLAACGGSGQEAPNDTPAASESQAEPANDDAADDSTEDTEPAAAGDAVEISFWTMQLSPTFDDYLNSTIAGFEAENPDVKVNWVDVPWGDMENKILSAAASGTMPDVANLNPHFAQKLAQLGALADMEVLAGDVKDDYVPGAWAASSFEGKSFGIPWYLTTGITFYNKEMFEAAGLDVDAPPANFEEIMEIGQQIVEATGKYAYMPMFSDNHMLEDFEKGGVEIFNADYTEVNFTSDALVATVQMYKDMFDANLIPREAFTKGAGDMVQLYAAGEVAIFQGGTSHAGMIESASQEVYNNTGIAPQLLGENGGKVNVAVMNIVIAESSPNQEPAARFAKYLTNDANQTEFCEISGAILPSTLSSLDNPYFASADSIKDEARVVSAQQLPLSEVIFPPIKDWSELSQILVDAVAMVILEDADMMATLTNAEEKANELLNS